MKMQERLQQMRQNRVAIYARVSTEEQAEHGYSIDAQIDTLRTDCNQKGKLIAGEYVDRGISGKEMTKRHELKRLLRDAENGLFDEVVVWKINRLSRKTKDLLEIVERLNKCNVYFRSYSETFETETPMGRFALQMMGAVGEFERNTIVENVRLGLKQRARMGLHNGGSCLGYTSMELEGSDRKNRKTKLVIVPEEAVTVRKIFDLYVAGKGFRGIANQLNHEGHRTKKGNTFSSDSIREIITNPIYVGAIRYNRFEGWSEKRRRGKSSNPIVTQGKHEAIITADLWERVQALFGQKSKASARKYDSNNLLTGLIRCPQCGAPMVASRTVNYLKDGTKVVRRYYSCGQFRTKGSSVCRANSVQADHAEQVVFSRIKEVLYQPKLLECIVNAINSKRKKSLRPLNEELLTIDSNLKRLAEKKQKVMELYELDAMDRQTLVGRVDELTAEEDALHARKSEIIYELGSDATSEISYEKVKQLMNNLQELLDQASPEQRKCLLHLVIKEIQVGINHKIGSIELQLDESVIASNTQIDPSADKAEGSISIWRRNKYCIII